MKSLTGSLTEDELRLVGEIVREDMLRERAWDRKMARALLAIQLHAAGDLTEADVEAVAARPVEHFL